MTRAFNEENGDIDQPSELRPLREQFADFTARQTGY